MLLLRPEIRKCVNDDTENQIKHDNNDDKVEEEVVNDASRVGRFLHKI